MRTRTKSGVIGTPGSHYRRRFLETDGSEVQKKTKTPTSGKSKITNKASQKRQSTDDVQVGQVEANSSSASNTAKRKVQSRAGVCLKVKKARADAIKGQPLQGKRQSLVSHSPESSEQKENKVRDNQPKEDSDDCGSLQPSQQTEYSDYGGDQKSRQTPNESYPEPKTRRFGGRRQSDQGGEKRKAFVHSQSFQKSNSSEPTTGSEHGGGEAEWNVQRERHYLNTASRHEHISGSVDTVSEDTQVSSPSVDTSTTADASLSRQEGRKEKALEKTLACDVCGKIFHILRLLKKHQATHADLSSSGDIEKDDVQRGKHFACDVCDMIFKSAHLLTKHKMLHEKGESATQTEQLSCSVCGKEFKNAYALKKHKMVHSGERPFVCDECGKRFTQVSNLKMHMLTHTGEKPFKCDTCSKHFARAGDLKKHQLIHVEGRPFICDVCNKSFVTLSTLNVHKDIHLSDTDKPYKCEVCGKGFSKAWSLKAHKVIHSGLRPFKCDVCNKAFTTAGNLKEHKQTHTGQRPFSCNICGKKFTKLFPLKKHMMLHTGFRPHPCDMCDKGYATKSELEIHKRTHTGERPFKCEYCVADFFRKANLLQHVNAVHKGLRPHICDVCGKAFTEARSLVEHCRIHSGEKPYVCDICSKSFTQASTLKNHKRVHSGEKPYPCLHCGKRFSEISSRNRHHRTHTGEAPYRCSHCPADFSRKETLKLHVRNHHPDSEAGEGTKRVIRDHAAVDHSYDTPVSAAPLSNSDAGHKTSRPAPLSCVPCVITVFSNSGFLYQGTMLDSGMASEMASDSTQGFPYIVSVENSGVVVEEFPRASSIMSVTDAVEREEVTLSQEASSQLALTPDDVKFKADIIDAGILSHIDELAAPVVLPQPLAAVPVKVEEEEVKMEDLSDIETVVSSQTDSEFHTSVVSPQESTGLVDAGTPVSEEHPLTTPSNNNPQLQEAVISIGDTAEAMLVYQDTEKDDDVQNPSVCISQCEGNSQNTINVNISSEESHTLQPGIVEIVIEGHNALSSVVESLVDSSGAFRATLVDTSSEAEELLKKVIVESAPEMNCANDDAVKIPGESDELAWKPDITESQDTDPASLDSTQWESSHDDDVAADQLPHGQFSDADVRQHTSGHHAILRDLLTKPVAPASRGSRSKMKKKAHTSVGPRPAGTKGLFNVFTFRKRKYGAVPKAWICEVCGHGFTQSASLRNHIAVQHHSGRTINCDVCRKPCRSKSELESHKRSHTGARPFQCQLCEKTYKHNGDLQQHILAGHMGAKPFSCDQCGKSFTEKRSLKEHKLIHVGIRPHKCACGKAFTQLGTLKKHQRTHQQTSAESESENLCVCETCGKGFSTPALLNEHWMLHTGEDRYQCVHCPAVFAESLLLQQHKSDAHPDKLQDLATVASLALASR